MCYYKVQHKRSTERSFKTSKVSKWENGNWYIQQLSREYQKLLKFNEGISDTSKFSNSHKPSTVRLQKLPPSLIASSDATQRNNSKLVIQQEIRN